MGRRPIVRRRGSSPNFMAPNQKRPGPAKYDVALKGDGSPAKLTVAKLLHDPGRGAPLALLKADGRSFMTIPAEGTFVGQEIEMGQGARPTVGNILPLSEAPESSMLFNIERKPSDGGALFRSSGNYAVVVGKNPDATVVLKGAKGRLFNLDGRNLATVGISAGGGRTEKPFLNAGVKWKLMMSRGRLWPRVRGVAMGSPYHPHGGGRHQHAGHPTSVSRNKPPGAKVGLIAPRQTGRARGRSQRAAKREY
jgi:large subunit ribosomal protein L2